MPKNSNRNRGSGSNESMFSGWSDTARENRMASAAVAAAAVGAGIFLWSKRNQISNQLSGLSDQISEWTDSMRSSGNSGDFETAGASGSASTSGAATGSTSSRTSRSTGSRPTSTKARTGRGNRGMSETGGGNASLGSHTGSGSGASGE